jgi:hypothetical protein
MRLTGFKLYKDRHGRQRCYHRKSGVAIDLGKYPIGSKEFFDQCSTIKRFHEPKQEEVIHVYLFKDGPLVKIGSTKDIEGRFNAIRTVSGREIVLAAFTRGSREDERALHHRFKKYRQTGEWFRIEGSLAKFMVNAKQNLAKSIVPTGSQSLGKSPIGERSVSTPSDSLSNQARSL